MLHFAALWLLVRVVGRLPVRLLYAAADAAGTLAWHASPRLRRTTRDHMRHVLLHGSAVGESRRGGPSRPGLCAQPPPATTPTSPARRISPPSRRSRRPEIFEGLAHFFDAYDRGCGVILCSAHLGSPEYIFRSASFLGLEMAVLTEVLSPPRLHDFVHRVRGAPGVRFLPADRGGLRETLTQLRGGGVVAVLGDRDIQGAGRPVPFFGERAALPSGPVELALRTERGAGARLRHAVRRRALPHHLPARAGAPAQRRPRGGHRGGNEGAGASAGARHQRRARSVVRAPSRLARPTALCELRAYNGAHGI